MSYVKMSLSEIPNLMRQASALAKERSRESSRILRNVLLTVSPLLLLILSLLLFLAFLPSVLKYPVSPKSTPNPNLSATTILLVVLGILVGLAYVLWMIYYLSLSAEASIKLGLATVDNDESIRERKRGWALIRLGLLFVVPIAILQALLRSAGLETAIVRTITEIIFCLLFLTAPAVIESGSAIDAFRKAWLLMGSHTLFVFACGLVATIPSIITPIFPVLPIPKTGTIILQLFSLVFSLWFDFKYAPFFVALVYRSVNPKEEDVPLSENSALSNAYEA